MELAIAIVGGLTALVVLITAYVNYKKEKDKNRLMIIKLMPVAEMENLYIPETQETEIYQ